MMDIMRKHTYQTTVTWIGNLGTGTSGYSDYARDCDIDAPGRPAVPGSADPTFRGDPARWNPEQLLVAALAQCHMLWYLHLCAVNDVVVTRYVDTAVGTMVETYNGGGAFREVVLRPEIDVAHPDMRARAAALHDEAHRLCFIANSVDFPVRREPAIGLADPSPAP
jgi:organic hydroperoxide reductase OsmC/OhrA